MSDSERQENPVVDECLDNLRQEAVYKPISLTNRILLSLSAGCLITGVLYLLFLLALVRMADNRGAGWTRLYDVMSGLWSPAIRCSEYFHLTGPGHIWLAVACNVIIYSFSVFVISSIYLRWVKR
jgi:hypothetical protein